MTHPTADPLSTTSELLETPRTRARDSSEGRCRAWSDRVARLSSLSILVKPQRNAEMDGRL